MADAAGHGLRADISNGAGVAVAGRTGLVVRLERQSQGFCLSRFTQDVANYQLVTAPLDAVAAYTVPWVEMVAGICLLLGLLRRGTLLVLAGLVTIFAVAIAWAWLKQLDIACGCHGGDAPIRYWSKVLEFAAYYAAFAGLWWLENSRPGGARWTRSHCGGSAATTGC